MNVWKCYSCGRIKPQTYEHYSRYSGKRQRWKHVCNQCIEDAKEKRKRVSSAPSLDGLKNRLPIESVFHMWRRIDG